MEGNVASKKDCGRKLKSKGTREYQKTVAKENTVFPDLNNQTLIRKSRNTNFNGISSIDKAGIILLILSVFPIF